ncbi:hypothetical protein OROHE_023155 [Orobanche hederae]
MRCKPHNIHKKLAPRSFFLQPHLKVPLDAIEANKASWGALFEPFAFFKAYKNYLQIDIAAENDDDMMNWKGWVESRIRLLTLQIERDMNGILQCHPYPGDFPDKSKPFHHSYFMGLRKKKGANPQEREQFDMRMTVEYFKRDVYAYSCWKPTMWIHVCHVKQKDIPHFVFPGGVRPSPAGKTSSESRSVQITSRKKRKQDEVNRGIVFTESSSTTTCISDGTSLDETRAKKQAQPDFSTTTSNSGGFPEDLSDHGPEIMGFGAPGLEKPIREQFFPQTTNHQGPPEVFEGVADGVQMETKIQHDGETEGIKLSPALSFEQGVGAAGTGTAPPCSIIQPKGDLEELEPLELSVTSATASAPANVPAQKPLIRFSFTSLPKATGKSA